MHTIHKHCRPVMYSWDYTHTCTTHNMHKLHNTLITSELVKQDILIGQGEDGGGVWHGVKHTETTINITVKHKLQCVLIRSISPVVYAEEV